MDTIRFAIVVCIAQVSAIALLGLIVSWASVRLRPALSSSLLASVLAVITLLTLLCPLPVSGCFALLPESVIRFQDSCATDLAHQSPSSTAGAKQLGQSDIALSGLQLGLAEIRGVVSALSGSTRDEGLRSNWLAPAEGLLLTACLFGIVRWVASLYYTRQLVQQSEPVQDTAVLNELSRMLVELAGDRSDRYSVELRQSDRISSAAATGHFRPTILLPINWRLWSEDQLQSVLAHELSHILRRDYWWRLSACLVVAVHFYNPLLHLLLRRFALAQEVTADLTAAQAIGQVRYMQAISSLALQREESSICFTKAGLNPVFSGYLIRRIKMLQKMNVSDARRVSVVAKTAGIAAVMTIGLMAIAARGFAQPPEAKPAERPDARIARADRPASVERSKDPTKGMFQRKKIDPSEIVENPTGMIVLRIGDLLRSIDAVSQIGLLSAWGAPTLQDTLQSPDVPPFDLNQIDVAYGATQFSTRYDPEAESNKNRVMFGVGEMMIRFLHPVDLSAWIDSYVPDAKETVRDERTYYTLPIIPAMGPFPMSIASRDDSTICFSATHHAAQGADNALGRLERLVQSVTHQAKPNSSAWAAAMRQVDGGLFSYAVTDAEVRTPKEFLADDAHSQTERQAALRFHRLLHTFDTFALGIDLSEDRQRIGIRIHVRGNDSGANDQIEEDLKSLRLFALGRFHQEDLISTEADVDEETYEDLTLEFLRELVIQPIGETGASKYVNLRSSIDASKVGLLVSSMLADAAREISAEDPQ